jgi:glycosyltransferase involved in cell wall biosynthesis
MFARIPVYAGRMDDGTGPNHALRVDFITETYPPEINGVARTLERMVHGLAGRGHAVRLIRPRQHAADEGSVGVETALVRGAPLPGYRGLRMGLPSGARIAHLWRMRRPDVVYVATEGPLGWSAIRTAAKARIPVVSGFHTHFPDYARHYGVSFLERPLHRYLRDLHRRTHCTLVPTEELKQALGADFGQLEVLGRGVDSDAFSPRRRSEALRRRWGVEPDDRVVLYVGRLAVEKNLPLALSTYRVMRTLDPRLRCVIVGSGPLDGTLAKDEPDIHFTGALPRGELIEHYASSDIFLFPSESETFGNVTLEAMASGLAVVAFDYAAARVLIENRVNGMLANRGDHDAFVAAAVRLARQHPPLDAMRAAARSTAEAHHWDSVLGRFEAIMRRSAHEK